MWLWMCLRERERENLLIGGIELVMVMFSGVGGGVQTISSPWTDVCVYVQIPRPDNKPDTLGLTVLDEPCAKQSDPTVLDLQLRAISKQTTAKTLVSVMLFFFGCVLHEVCVCVCMCVCVCVHVCV